MAGSADIAGRQNYVLGIGHPKNSAVEEGAPAVFNQSGTAINGPNGAYTYPPSTWAAIPSAAAVPGAVIRCTDIGNSAAGTMLISDGVYWRPVGGQVHIVERSGSPFYPLTQNTGSTGFNFTLPVAGVIPANFLIPGESQIEVEVWVKKTGANGTATLNVYLGLNNSNTTDYRIIQGTFAAADGSELGLRPLVTVGNALRLSSSTFLSVGTVSPQTNTGTDSAGGMFNSAVPTYLTINVGAANAADTFRLCAYRVTVKQ